MRRSFLCNLEKMEIVNKWTHLKIHNGEKSSKCNQSHHGSCLRGHLKQARKPKICQLRTHSLSQQGNSYLKHSGEKSLVQSLQCIYKDAVTVNSPSLVTHLKVHSGDKAMRRWFLCKLVKWRWSQQVDAIFIAISSYFPSP